MKFMLKKRKGFTLIELIVVIAILGILAAVLIPRFGGFQDRARRTQAITDAKQVATAIDSLFAEKGSWTSISNTEITTMAFAGDTLTGRLFNTDHTFETYRGVVQRAGAFLWQYTPTGSTTVYYAGRVSASSPIQAYADVAAFVAALPPTS